MAMRIRRSYVVGVLAVGLIAAPGCEEKKAPPKPASEGADGGALRPSKVDKSIVEALAAAGSAAAGPPESGVFAPGAADREIKPGDPAKLSLGGKGSGATRRPLAGPPRPGRKPGGKVG